MYLLIGIRRTILNRCRNKNAHSYNDLNDLVEKKSVDKVVKAVILSMSTIIFLNLRWIRMDYLLISIFLAKVFFIERTY